MLGVVDDQCRALIDIAVSNQRDGAFSSLTVWIDTAFDGHLVFPRELISRLGLESLVETEAILADGSRVTLETFLCFIEWFGNRLPLQVIANEGRLPLLGTGLLDHRILHIDYARKELSLE